MDSRAALIELLASYLEGKITRAELKASLTTVKPAFETGMLLNQLNAATNPEEIKTFVTDCLNDLMK